MQYDSYTKSFYNSFGNQIKIELRLLVNNDGSDEFDTPLNLTFGQRENYANSLIDAIIDVEDFEYQFNELPIGALKFECKLKLYNSETPYFLKDGINGEMINRTKRTAIQFNDYYNFCNMTRRDRYNIGSRLPVWGVDYTYQLPKSILLIYADYKCLGMFIQKEQTKRTTTDSEISIEYSDVFKFAMEQTTFDKVQDLAYFIYKYEYYKNKAFNVMPFLVDNAYYIMNNNLPHWYIKAITSPNGMSEKIVHMSLGFFHSLIQTIALNIFADLCCIDFHLLDSYSSDESYNYSVRSKIRYSPFNLPTHLFELYEQGYKSTNKLDATYDNSGNITAYPEPIPQKDQYFTAFIVDTDNNVVGGRLHKDFNDGFFKKQKNAFKYYTEIAEECQGRFWFSVGLEYSGKPYFFYGISPFNEPSGKTINLPFTSDMSVDRYYGKRYKVTASNYDNLENDIEKITIEAGTSAGEIIAPMIWNSRPQTNDIGRKTITFRDNSFVRANTSNYNTDRYCDLFYLKSMYNSDYWNYWLYRCHEASRLYLGNNSYIDVGAKVWNLAANICYNDRMAVETQKQNCLDSVVAKAAEYAIQSANYEITANAIYLPIPDSSLNIGAEIIGADAIMDIMNNLFVPVGSAFTYGLEFTPSDGSIERKLDLPANRQWRIKSMKIKSLKDMDCEICLIG